jgi:anhydro-N-acetylmuramic acid kinase
MRNKGVALKVIGVMTGTSVDAIDVALCEIHAAPPPTPAGTLALRLLTYQEQPFPEGVRQRILGLLQDGAGKLAELAELNFLLGQVLASAVLTTVEATQYSLDEIDLIASHGQTVYHLVEPGRRYATWQIGEAAVLAAETGLTVIADFRVADIAAGGQGAPLVSFLDALMFASDQRTRALQNIGGIGNVTFLPAGASMNDVYAFDTGPGNVLIDYAARYFSQGTMRYDHDGIMAQAGQMDRALLDEVLAHPYFHRSPPKTTGRELFGDAFAAALIEQALQRGLSPEDIVATFTAITAESIAAAYRDFGPEHIDEVIISGGGTYNPALMKMLSTALPATEVTRYDTYGLSANAKEAAAFAVLGYETLHGRAANVPRCTGARAPVVLGKITPGANFRSLLTRSGLTVEEKNAWAQTRKLILLH